MSLSWGETGNEHPPASWRTVCGWTLVAVIVALCVCLLALGGVE